MKGSVPFVTQTCRHGREFTCPRAFYESVDWFLPRTTSDCECWLGPGRCYLDRREHHAREGLVLSSELDWELLPLSCTVDPDQVASPANAVREVMVGTPVYPTRHTATVVIQAEALEERRRLCWQKGYFNFSFRALLLYPVRALQVPRGMVVAGQWASTGMCKVAVVPSKEFSTTKIRMTEAALAGAEGEVLTQARRLRHMTRPVDVRHYRKDGRQPPVDLDGFLVDM
jgi:hypothetical protein